MSVLPISVPTKRLALPITSSALAFSVGDILGWDGNDLNPSQFGTLHYVAFRNSQNSAMEIVEIDPTTIANGTITITKRGLDFVGGTTPVTANQLPWPANDTLVDFGSDPAQLLTQGFMDLWNDQTVTGVKTFISPPVSATNPSSADQVANKAYVDAASFGSATYDQNVIGGTAGAILAAGNVVYFLSSDQKWHLADQGTASTCVGVQLGIAQGASTNGNPVNVLIAGLDKKQTGLTAGNDYYLSSAGAISSSAGATNQVFIGRAASTTTLLFAAWFSKAMLGDDVSIPLGSGNKLITQTGAQNRAETYATSTGSANAYVLTLTPAPVAYVAGQEFEFKANFGNTGSATLNVNTLGAKTIKKLDGATNLISGDIANGQTVKFKYDGANFQMLSPSALSPIFKAVTATKVESDSSTAQTIAHGLGRVPKYVRISANTVVAVSTIGDSLWAEAMYDGTTQTNVNYYDSGSGSLVLNTGATLILSSASTGGSNNQSGVVTFDGTNVSITWTKNGTPGSKTWTLLVEAYG